MSATRLPRELGIIIRCNGTDKEHCSEKFQTANVRVKVNRKAAAQQGWGRGLRKGHKRQDHCPTHLAIERELFAQAKVKRAADIKARDEKRKAAFAAKPPKAKKPRKKKASTALSVGAVTKAEEANIGRPPTSSPSAASALAPST